MTGQARQAPGLVRIRLSGRQEDVTRVAAFLTEQGHAGGLTVLEVSAPYENRREPGVRVYVTALAGQGGESR